MRLRNWIVPVSLIAVLAVVGMDNFLLFHVLAELFAVIVAALLFAVAWHTYPFSRNGFLMVLACGYFWIGMVDLLHALIYKGMGVFPVASANPATQLWLAARYGQAVLLAAAPFFLGRTVHRVPLFVAFGAVFALVVAWVLSGRFPEAYIDGQGLTPFKIASEYVIIAILALALVHLLRRRTDVGRTAASLLALSVGLTMAAELCFTLYVGVYDMAAEAGAKVIGLDMDMASLDRLYLRAREQKAQVIPLRMDITNPSPGIGWRLETRVEERTADLKREVEKRRHAEMAIGASEARLRAILEHSPAVISLKDLQGKYLLVNAEFERLLGVRRSDALGRRASDVVEAEAARRLEENHGMVVRTRQPQRFEYETALPDGGRHALMAVSFPVFGNDGALAAVGTISTDVTEYKKTDEQLRQSQKVQALGDLAGGLAHELNNMLQPVVALSGVLARRLSDEQDRRAIDMVLKAALRARDLIAQVQTFGRRDTLRLVTAARCSSLPCTT